jgi:hypothetical protein
LSEMFADLLEIEIFEGAIGGLLKMNDDRHDFTELESGFALSFECSRFEKFEFEMGLKVIAEIVNGNEKR